MTMSILPRRAARPKMGLLSYALSVRYTLNRMILRGRRQGAGRQIREAMV